MTNDRLFKKEYAQELLKVSQGDLETAKVLMEAKLTRKENTLFHIQQAIEKALKSYICWLEKPVPLVHDLSEILRVIPDHENIPHHESLYDLTQFATVRRYEEGVAVITDEEVVAAHIVAQEILEWVAAKLRV